LAGERATDRAADRSGSRRGGPGAQRRIETRYLDVIAKDLDEALAKAVDKADLGRRFGR
jgi:hypothetical protein